MVLPQVSPYELGVEWTYQAALRGAHEWNIAQTTGCRDMEKWKRSGQVSGIFSECHMVKWLLSSLEAFQGSLASWPFLSDRELCEWCMGYAWLELLFRRKICLLTSMFTICLSILENSNFSSLCGLVALEDRSWEVTALSHCISWRDTMGWKDRVSGSWITPCGCRFTGFKALSGLLFGNISYFVWSRERSLVPDALDLLGLCSSMSQWWWGAVCLPEMG